MESGAELTVLELSDMSRCVSCRRLVTLRRILSEGMCKCGSRRVIDATFLNEDDLLEVEEDYGWDVKITGVGEQNVAKGLLSGRDSSPEHEGNRVLVVDEARLHSGEAGEYKRGRDKRHGVLGIRNWWAGISPSSKLKSPGEYNELIRKLRKPQFFFSKKHEG